MIGRDDDEDARKLAILDTLFIEELVALEVPEDSSTKAVAEAVRTRLRAAEMTVGKRRRAAAGAAARAARSHLRGPSSGVARGAAALRDVRSSNPALDGKLTMAARNAGQDAEADQIGVEQDLADLEAWEKRDEGEQG